MPYEVNELVRRGWNQQYELDLTTHQNAYNLVRNAVDRTNIALVQGPPGTGKTTLYQGVLHDSLDRFANGNPVLYIAPTNRLVADMLERMSSVYRDTGRNENDLYREVRIYGSQFHFNDANRRLNQEMDSDVRLVITTEYQRAIMSNMENTFHMMIDEASRSPLQRPFISLAEPLIRSIEEGRSILDSISVIGDPRQAIALNDQYRNENKRLLVMESFIRGLLSDRARAEVDRGRDMLDAALEELRGRTFEFLEVSRRMPSPSEVPISRGYYNNRLRSHFTAAQRLRDAWNPELLGLLRTQSELFSKAVDKIEEAISTHRPMIYVKTERGYDDKQFLYDPVRAEAGLIFAVCLTVITKFPTTIITTYTDQGTQMEIMYDRQYRPMMRRLNLDGLIRFSTVHKMLGSQDHNIVAILGKEYTGFDDRSTTIYFQEPELLNVQLSRHLRMIVIVGNLSLLITAVNKAHQNKGTTQYANMRTTSEAIYELSGVERQPTTGRMRRLRDGNGCVFTSFGPNS